MAADRPSLRAPVEFETRQVEGRGIAITFAVDGSLVELSGPSPRLIVWSAAGKLGGEFPIDGQGAQSPTDISSDGGFGFLVVGPEKSTILRFGRRGDFLRESILPGDVPVEPQSICSGDDGRSYLLNRVDGDIWRIETDGTVTPLMIPAAHRKPILGGQIAFDRENGAVWLLRGSRLYGYTVGGAPKFTRNCPVESVVDFAVADGVLWMVGNGLCAMNVKSPENMVVWSSDDLKQWGIEKPLSLAISSNRLTLLAENGAIVALEIERLPDGR